MPPRLHVDLPLVAGATTALPSGAARHVQVLRLQPDSVLTLFDGRGGEWSARVVAIGRSEVTVHIGDHDPVDRELPYRITLALGMPANDRMDFVIEKATELGASVIQPLVCERSVLRLEGERAVKKVAHWQAVAVAAAEQSGRTRIPTVAPVRPLLRWLGSLGGDADGARWLLGFDGARPLGEVAAGTLVRDYVSLSGPEGGFSDEEQFAATAAGFAVVSLGPRVLRADTAPLALLAWLGLSAA